ncbi:Multidrug/Oligosaccharidyl-lipid/Polysaccharide (MOP) Flippase Superfamily [Phytophthora infestans T30-4]|uniref:Multidrug/Oligosaccharidyl-lipid/Polysaccharide (MOP) Flippase Superfamily n=1 Tax=Phytophthora infestans (strain T30-4) TaxID=403677 RepID=D0P2I9_PHYIT|nr:Multidrug/Oligosaccharidyl-lipid/Polysaccharide (MOP) Flippase Superfamily [Phytophthora infestans T30-4]EEY56285.1 Multidrug/Oligosaccharidyl-lipid/Polysaccharide (MOP) Flippase Superfamily [Phytophthora infestans T30-4]|eukprot:XP_002895483.1 Multidrug/Oligosaccharidyl-lipid/Polysaccharide (MOP) Flippase Superfamily [Phytophthora infestans T30-4]
MGHLGVDELAAVAYAQLCLDLSTLVFMQGFNGGMNSLCSQAFGAKNYHLVGEYTLLTSLLLTVACAPMALLWWNLDRLLLTAGVAEHVAFLAGQYGRLSLLWLWPRSMFQVLASFYQAQNIVLSTAVFDVLMVIFNCFFAIGLTYGQFGLPELGFIGCPLGTAVAVALRLVSYVAYMNIYHRYHQQCSWRWDTHFLNKEIVWNLVSVGVPLAAGELLENAQLTVLTLFAAKIGELQLGTHNAMMELFFFATSPLYAVIGGSVTRMGNHLGAGQPSYAVVAAKICGHLGRIFSDDPAVTTAFSQVCSLAALAYTVLSFFCYALAVLQAQARPMPLALGMVAGAWLVGVPSAYWMGVHTAHPSLLGLWKGMICGYTEADKAVARSHLKEKELASPQESDRLLA